MDTRPIRQPLTTFLNRLSRRIQVRKLIVFGSRLEGNAHSDSDIDVFVISDDFLHLSEDDRLDILEDAAEGIDPEVHPWGFTSEELARASRLTTLGYARGSGYRFTPQQSSGAHL